jgi:hypothetical protein
VTVVAAGVVVVGASAAVGRVEDQKVRDYHSFQLGAVPWRSVDAGVVAVGHVPFGSRRELKREALINFNVKIILVGILYFYIL